MVDFLLHSLAGKDPSVYHDGTILERNGDYDIRQNVVVFFYTITAGSIVNIYNPNNLFFGAYRFDGAVWIQITAKVGCTDIQQEMLSFNANNKEPRNNDGRDKCFWCGGNVKEIQGFSSAYSVCEACGK